MTNLVLKDALGADITLAYIGKTPDGVLYEKVSATLMGRTRALLTLVEGAKTNRVRGKVTVPTTALSAVGSIPEIVYTEIGSFDFSVYRAGQETGRKDIAAMVAAFVSSPQVTAAIVDGVKPNA